jgi:hypothetical protein
MVRRRGNPFAEKQRRLPHRAFIKREGPWRPADWDEIEAACRRIANGAEYLTWSGSRGLELGCTVIGFDTSKKAVEMQVWIDTGGIADRPLPQSPPGLPQLKCG